MRCDWAEEEAPKAAAPMIWFRAAEEVAARATSMAVPMDPEKQEEPPPAERTHVPMTRVKLGLELLTCL